MSFHSALNFASNKAVFVRYDAVEFKTDASISNQTTYLPISGDAKKYNVLIAGYDHGLGKNIHIIPNIEKVGHSSPKTGALKPKSDTISRVTFAYKF